MVLFKEAINRTCMDLSQMGHRLVVNPFQIQGGKQAIFKIMLSFLVGCFLLLGVTVFPFLTQQLSKNTRETIYLNVMEPYGDGNSSLCTFKAKSAGNWILNTTLSEDNRVIIISFPGQGPQKVNCLPYKSELPFYESGTEGTIINIFASKGHEFFANDNSDDSKGIIVRSDTPLHVVIRNEDAVLVQSSNLTMSLIKGLVNFDSKVEKISSKNLAFLDFEGEFSFSSKLKTTNALKNPKVFLYSTPKLDEVDFTPLSTFRKTPNLKVNFGLKDPKERTTFVRLNAILNSSSVPELNHSEDLNISKWECVGVAKPKQSRTLSNLVFYGAIIIISLIIGLFSFNLYDLTSGVHKKKEVVVETNHSEPQHQKEHNKHRKRAHREKNH